MPRCPGQDMRFWTPADIFDVSCPYCDYPIEFWRDEPFRLCRSCQKEVRNPRIDLRCASWCKFGDQCLGRSATEQLAAAPVIEKLTALLEPLAKTDAAGYERIQELVRYSNLLLTSEGGDPCRVKTGALLVGYLHQHNAPAEAARAMLQATILEAAEIEAIVALVSQVLARESPDSLDATIVRDAQVLAQTTLQDDRDLQALTTEGAKMIFQLRRNKKTAPQ